jgi:hypothetical protein
MTYNWVKDINEMHHKFGVKEWFEKNKDDKDIMSKYLRFRLKMCMEEMNETIDAAIFDRNPEEVVDGLIDLCVFAIGTLDVFGVDANEAWDKVHKANMDKEAGVKPGRPNPFGLPDLLKPSGWTAPSHEGNHGNITNAL